MQLDSARALESAVHGRVVFLLSTPESGAEQVLRALGCLGGVAAAPVPTHLFSQGVESLLDTWLSRMKDALGERADDGRFLADVRMLTDAPLAARCDATGAERVVEYSHDHVRLVGPMMVLYPDAQFVHVVRDGRQVAANLASPLLGWAPFEAARRWCDDQRAVMALWGQPNLHVVRIEDVREDPAFFLGEVASRIGLQPSAKEFDDAADVLGNGHRPLPDDAPGRAGTLVDVLGADLLDACGYDTVEPSRLRWLAAQLELGAVGEVAWAARGAIRRARAAVQDGD